MQYDVVLYGAGGFTGRQTVAYFAKHAPPGTRWAVAGRHRPKLESALAAAGASAIDIFVADSRDQASVDAVAARTRVLLTTAGPFALYGTPVVDACVRFGTDYVDITGESGWVRELVGRYHDRAAEQATRIIPFCGFDSVPSDLAAFLLVRQLQRRPVTHLDVRTYFRLSGGGLNGGTAATMLNIAQTGGTGPSSGRKPRLRPHYDSQAGAWVGPFFMGPINSWVVRRSGALQAEYGDPYPPQMTYQEFLRYSPPFAGFKALAATTGAGLLLAALKSAAVRPLIARMLPEPGTGPSEADIERGWIECLTVGRTDDGRRAQVNLASSGDAGNRSTVRFACESALALAFDTDRLPGGPTRGGVLTPATGLGDVLGDRLRRSGVTIEVTSEAA